MQYQHLTFRRPAVVLALAIALTALLTTLACGSAAQPDPTTTPAATQSQSMTEQGNDHLAGAASSSQDADSGNSTESEAPTGAVAINLPIAGRSTTVTRDDLRVSQGDTVRLTFEADEEGEIHLHGYDLTADVSPGHPGELVFEAATAGAFALNFHVFGSADDQPADDHHGATARATVASERPVSVHITAESDGQAGVNVTIVTPGFQFAPGLVDQAHTPGSGHAHIYADGVKLGRVFDTQYHIEELAPGDHEIRVVLNTNDHSELTYDGHVVEATATVTVPDVGQNVAPAPAQQSSDGHGHDHGHSHDAPGDRQIIAEVHLGNLEVYP